jgi:CHAT domain-containing protein
MKNIFLLILIFFTFQSFSQKSFYTNSKYIEARTAFEKTDFKKFKKIVKSQLSKNNAPNIFIDLANKIIVDLDPDFENELTDSQKEIALFSRQVNQLHEKARYYDIYLIYKQCNFLEKLSPSTFYQLTSSVDEISYEDYKKLIDLDLKVNGDHFRAAWNIGLLSTNSINIAFQLWSDITSNPYYNAYPGVKNYAIHLKKYNPNMGITDWANYSKLYGVNEFIQSNPNDALAYRRLGHVLKGLDRYEEAKIAYLKSNEIDPFYSDGSSLKDAIVCAYLLEQDIEANDLIKKMVKNRFPNSNQEIKFLEISSKLLSNAGNKTKARKQLATLLDKEPQHETAIIQLSQIENTANRKKEVLKLYQKLPKETLSNNLNLYNSYLNVLKSLEMFDEFIEEWQSFIEEDKIGNETSYNRFYSYFSSIDEKEMAIEMIDKALELFPLSAWTLRNSTQVKMDLEQYSDAEVDLRKSIEIDPNHNWAKSKFKTIIKVNNKNEQNEIESLYNQYPSSYRLLEALNEIQAEEDQISFLKNFEGENIDLIRDRNIYVSSSGKDLINYLESKLSLAETKLDSLFYSNLIYDEKYRYILKNSMPEDDLNNMISLSNRFLELGGNTHTYHKHRAFIFRSLKDTDQAKVEANLAIKASPNDHNYIRQTIVDFSNSKGFIALRKSLDRDLFQYNNIERFVWVNSLYGGSNINAIWAYEKCKDNFPDSNCSTASYLKAIEALGDPYKNMEYYKKQTDLSTSNRYIDWYNTTKEKTLSAKKQIIYDKQENKLTTIDENGEISIRKDDPYSGQPILNQKGSVWIKYAYTKNGDLAEINTSAKEGIKLVYNEDNKISEMIDENKITGDFRKFTFLYNEKRKPIKISLENVGTIDIIYDSSGEIEKVESKEGQKMAFQVTQGFQNLLSLTKSFSLDDIAIEDVLYNEVKKNYDDAYYEITYNESDLNNENINKYKKYISYLKSNLSNDGNYVTYALDASSEILTFLNSNISNDLKLQILDFSDDFYEILKEIRRRGVANTYWNKWNEILETLETEKQKQTRLNDYRKRIETLQAKFKEEPIQLLSSAEWLPKSSLNNNAYWTSTNLENISAHYDFANTPAKHILKRKNGDVLIAFDKGIAIKSNGFWKFLYYDTLNKKLLQDAALIKINSKTTFNNFAETVNETLYVNTSSGTFLIQDNYTRLTKIKFNDDNYIGNSSCRMLTFNSYLLLFSDTSVNLIKYHNDAFDLVQHANFPDKKIKKIKYFTDYGDNTEFIAQTNNGLETLLINTNTKKSELSEFIHFENIDDFEFHYDDYNDIFNFYLLSNKKLYKSIYNEYDLESINSKPREVLGNIILNKKVLGLSLIPVNIDETVLGVITDSGINLYKNNHFEFFKVQSKNGLDEFVPHYYFNNSEFGILTKQKILQFSLENYFYSSQTPSKIKHLEEAGLTLMLNNGSLYYSSDYEILSESVETDGWGTSIKDFDVAENEDVYLADYNTVYQVDFNKNTELNTYQLETLFQVDPFQPEDFYKSNSGIKHIKIAVDGTIWATTELSVFRYNKEMTPVLKEFSFFKNDKEFPAKSLEVFNLIETFDGKIMVVNSSERWNNYNGIPLEGGLVIYNKNKDIFEFLDGDKHKPDFPWFMTSYTQISNDEAILGTTSGFAYHSKGGIKSYSSIENKSYLDILKKYKNLFLGTNGVQFGDFLLFGCGEGVIAFKDNQWFFPERLNQLLPQYSEHGKWGGNKVNAIEVDHLQRLNIATDLGLLIINSNQIDPYDLLLMNRDINKTIEYYNIDKLQKEREKLVSSLPDNSNSKKIVDEAISLKEKIDDLQKSKISFAEDFKLKEVNFKTINIDSVNSEINRITKKHSDLLLTLKEKNPVIYQTLKIPPLEIAGIRRKLKEDECIVQYIPLSNKLIIQMITKEKLILKEVVVPKKELFNLSLIASDLLSNRKLVRGSIPHNERETDPSVSLDEILEQLYNNLISPIQSDLVPFKNKVQIIAEGALNYVPFESLIVKDGKDNIHYAAENFKFIYLSSLYMRQLLIDFPELENNNYLLVGDPDSSLPFARQEVEEIAEKFSGNTTLYIGNKAKVNAFRTSSKNKGIIHLATHGFVDRTTIKDSWLLFSDSKLMLSEVYELNLEETELMVLSACETGLGKDGIETTTLARAFANAGVQNLIASLWKVDDESTKILMNNFYDNVKSGTSYLDALHNAQMHLMKYNNGQFKSPKYWAPFILIGKP